MAGRLPGQGTGPSWGSMLGRGSSVLWQTQRLFFWPGLSSLPVWIRLGGVGGKWGAQRIQKRTTAAPFSRPPPPASGQKQEGGGRGGREPNGQTKWAFDCPPRPSPPGKPTLRLFITTAAQPRRSLEKSHWQPAGPTKVPLFAEGAPGWVLSEGASRFPHPAPPGPPLTLSPAQRRGARKEGDGAQTGLPD